MAKTANPNRYLDKFQEQLNDGVDRHRRLETALDKADETNETKKGIAEDSAFRLGILWETFQGDWFLASISREPAAFTGSIQDKLNSTLQDRWARRVIELMTPGALALPKQPTLQQIERTLDPQGYNLTFVDSKDWRKKSEEYLSGDFAKVALKISDDQEAASLLHLVKKMRNHLAHSSSGSKDEFNKAAKARTPNGRVGLTGPKNIDLKRDDRGVSDLGKYLRVRPQQNGPRRIEILHNKLSEVSELLRV